MKVAIDATPLTVPTGGIARYTRELFSALQAGFPEDHYQLLEPGPGRWWSHGLPVTLHRNRFDVFHGADFAVPYVPVCASVMTLHDLSPWKREPWRAASSRVRRRTPWLLRLNLATIIITPTEAIRREAMEFFGLPAERVAAVPEAAPALFQPPPEESRRGDFLLAVGAGGRKNLAMARAVAGHLGRELRVVGEGGPVSDAELADLYQRAAALLYPSFYEGFGLPLLEAMQSGAPVIASRDPALMEVSGGAALHVDAGDTRAWIEAVASVLRDPEPWRRRGLARAASFSWERTARLTRDLYLEAVCRHAR